MISKHFITRDPDRFDWDNNVRGLIQELLVEGHVELGGVAATLGISSRTFQRRLSEHGLIFSDMVEYVRNEAAVVLLTRTTTKIIDIALAIGYSEATSFTRAFRRRMGMTPRTYRKCFNREPPKGYRRAAACRFSCKRAAPGCRRWDQQLSGEDTQSAQGCDFDCRIAAFHGGAQGKGQSITGGSDEQHCAK
jgi:AraC-like DNA-binding protein